MIVFSLQLIAILAASRFLPRPLKPPDVGSRLLFCCPKIRCRIDGTTSRVLTSGQFPDQLVKLLRLRGERLHLVLSELRLKRQNLLKVLCLADLAGKREH